MNPPPHITWLSTETPEQVEALLHSQHVWPSSEQLRELTIAGEGNMNVTLRARSQHRSVIVKQSRHFVAKYDFIPAPIERIEYEAEFYRFAQVHSEISSAMPQLLAWVPEQYAMVLEDLGEAADATSLYCEGRQFSLPAIVAPLLQWLINLHHLSRGTIAQLAFENRQLRQLNHAHIFEIPFQDRPAIDLDAACPGLTEATQSLRTDPGLRAQCQQLGQRYLGSGACLLHGDFYPGSWLQSAAGPRVIDPEFCFAGPPEFDLGVLVGHLELCGCQQAISGIQELVEQYQQPIAATGATSPAIDWSLVEGFAGAEVLRRILGVAQLPLKLSLSQRVDLIQQAHRWVCAVETAG